MTKVPMDRLTGLGTSNILSFPRFSECCILLYFTFGPLDFIYAMNITTRRKVRSGCGTCRYKPFANHEKDLTEH